MTKINCKADVLNVIDELIERYLNETLMHSTSSCPLCKVYKSKRTGECDNCLNTAFYLDNMYYPCTQRCVDYKKLDYAYDDSEEALEAYTDYENNHRNDANLAKFWSEVKDLVEVSTEADVLNMTDDFKSKMLEIAEKYR